MEFHPNDWLGRWQNFESYITSTDPYLQLAWQEAEAAAAALPMFKSGAKQFWQTACVTTSIGNPHTLGGWTITPADGGKLCIAWTDADGNTLGRAVYHLDHVLEHGLEGKENALFVAEDVRRLAVPLPAGNGADAAPRGPAAGRAFKPPAFPVRQRSRALV